MTSENSTAERRPTWEYQPIHNVFDLVVALVEEALEREFWPKTDADYDRVNGWLATHLDVDAGRQVIDFFDDLRTKTLDVAAELGFLIGFNIATRGGANDYEAMVTAALGGLPRRDFDAEPPAIDWTKMH